MTVRPRVYIQQNCIAHYRRSTFERLCADPHVDIIVVTDTRPDTPFLELADLSTGRIRYRYAKNHIFSLPFVPNLFWQPGALRMVFRDRPDVIIALGNPYSLTAWGLLLLAIVLGTPVLLWSHGLLNDETGLKWVIRRCLYRLADGLLLYGERAKHLLESKGFRPGRLHVVFNALDFERQRAVDQHISDQELVAFRQSLGVGPEERLLAFTGRLQPAKRLDRLIRTVKALRDRQHCVHAVVIGDGSQRSALEALTAHLGIERYVHFLGASYDERVLALTLKASDLSVIPSAAGLSILHSLTFGTPVVIHDKLEEHGPEWEAIQEGRTGFFYHYDDDQHLLAVITDALFPHTKKPELSLYCRAMIETYYTPQTQAARIIQAIQSTCFALDGDAVTYSKTGPTDT